MDTVDVDWERDREGVMFSIEYWLDIKAREIAWYLAHKAYSEAAKAQAWRDGMEHTLSIINAVDERREAKQKGGSENEQVQARSNVKGVSLPPQDQRC